MAYFYDNPNLDNLAWTDGWASQSLSWNCDWNNPHPPHPPKMDYSFIISKPTSDIWACSHSQREHYDVKINEQGLHHNHAFYRNFTIIIHVECIYCQLKKSKEKSLGEQHHTSAKIRSEPGIAWNVSSFYLLRMKCTLPTSVIKGSLWSSVNCHMPKKDSSNRWPNILDIAKLSGISTPLIFPAEVDPLMVFVYVDSTASD